MTRETLRSPLELLEFSGLRRVPLILQAEIAECGLACIGMVANYHGHRLTMSALRQQGAAGLGGLNLLQMVQLGDRFDLAARPLRCPAERVGQLQLPCILHWEANHYVVLTKVRANQRVIHDPALGKRVLSPEEFERLYSGVALELTPTQGFVPQKQGARLALNQLWSRLTGFKTALLTLLGLSLLLQSFALATPYYLQWVVDEVLVSADRPLLTVLAIGFALLVLVNELTNGLRSWVILRLASMTNLQLGVNLLHHLLRLPMGFFERRQLGDLVSRFGSLNKIRERLTSGLIETLVDGLMAIAMVAMMMLYSPALTAVVLLAMACYALLRCALYAPLHRVTEESIQAQAKEQSLFLENLRAMQAIKLFGSEPQRQGLWQNRYAEVINADIRFGKLRIGIESVNNLLFSLENVLVIFLAAGAVMAGQLTIGMVLAFIAYKTQLTHRFTRLVEQLVQFRMLRLHLDRIADIALAKPEPHREGIGLSRQGGGQLTLEGVHFRYHPEGPEILKGVNLTIEAGQSLAIVGDSGCGKTTLMKLMLGLLQPSQGRVLLDGQEISTLGLRHYRQRVAAVMQNDTLLAGSVADNITFFDAEPSLVRMQQCAHRAAIDDEIDRLPMGYHSLVGEMGNQFSGGQSQRLLLARALYRQPTILFMDEATSHLDSGNEARISEQIRQLSMTRVLIAHRQESLKQADRIVRLEQGQLTEVSVARQQPA
ncbi:peptidase domain-containing ABC transporter [Ferrimonas marina]|uniref:ATP-binding cassette, subfamily B, RaxB n=1 Tax=Ferrimonas marina TaxID=299255 RepID=A0A1M5Y077_9GAMM|nr:peptidase domain-containing ABC transporter [Ferrimonas marina]SHI05208.1 ATP-binding cassette, subfamily B, RaxB [Ferrimonas marina]